MIFIWLFVFSAPLLVIAQSSYRVGGLPSLNMNKKLKNGWSINSKVESRFLFESGLINEASIQHYTYELSDLSIIAAKKVGLNSRISSGYQVRLDEGEIIHRLIQQYSIVQKLEGWRIAHRFATDQTFSKNAQIEYRLRYRITSEIPLNGESVDHQEFYIKLNNEYLQSLQDREYDIEIRLVPLLGYDVSTTFKIETGIDYRVNAFIHHQTRHSFWANLNLFIEL